MGKKITYSVLLVIVIAFFGLFFCDRIENHQSLGNNFSIFEGDKREDRVIVYCNQERNDCNGGIFVLPTYERHMSKDGKYAEYVEEAESNDLWIVAKTYQIMDKKSYYWIINKNFSLINVDCNITNCDSVIQEHIMGPYNKTEFDVILTKNNIDLNLK